jgi:hypothetical protein
VASSDNGRFCTRLNNSDMRGESGVWSRFI